MWDPEQIATMIVTIDRLQAEGDPLGEWLALRMQLDGARLSPDERRAARRRAAALREQLGSRLILADDPELGRPHVLREHGWIADVAFEPATPARLAALLARIDASMLLRVRLRGELDGLLACLDLLLDRDAARHPSRLRMLDFELAEAQPEAHEEAHAQLDKLLHARRDELASALPDLFQLLLDDRELPLPLIAGEPDEPGVWSARERTAIGRALADPRPDLRMRALERLQQPGARPSQLRAPLLRRVTNEPTRRVREQALELIDRLGPARITLLAHLGDWAREHDDVELRRWLRART